MHPITGLVSVIGRTVITATALTITTTVIGPDILAGEAGMTGEAIMAGVILGAEITETVNGAATMAAAEAGVGVEGTAKAVDRIGVAAMAEAGVRIGAVLMEADGDGDRFTARCRLNPSCLRQ
jgi:hypothetical protein